MFLKSSCPENFPNILLLVSCTCGPGLCYESYYDECVRHLNVKIGEHTCMLALTKKQVKPKNSCVANHLLFRILKRESKTFLTEMKELLKIRDKPCLNINITSVPLYLFDRPY